MTRELGINRNDEPAPADASRLKDLNAAPDYARKAAKAFGAAGARARRRVKLATDGEVAWAQMPLHFRVAPEPLWLIKPPAATAPAPI